VDHYRLDEVADGVLAAIAAPAGGGRGNAAIIEIDGESLVFDTGMTPQAGRELRQAAEPLGPVTWVVNSHWHGDHIRGNQAFADVEIVSTVRTKELIETRAANQLAEQKAFDFAALLATPPQRPSGSLDKSFDARLASVAELAATISDVELVPPTRTFDTRLELAPGCELLTLGGGHTESDAFLVLANRRVAIMGDLLAVEMHPWIGAGDPERWLEILADVEALDVDWFVPGHGRVATVEDVRAFRDHLRAFLAEPDRIESLYPGWDFWGDTADQNRAFLRGRTSSDDLPSVLPN
jgi:cyclase